MMTVATLFLSVHVPLAALLDEDVLSKMKRAYFTWDSLLNHFKANASTQPWR